MAERCPISQVFKCTKSLLKIAGLQAHAFQMAEMDIVADACSSLQIPKKYLLNVLYLIVL